MVVVRGRWESYGSRAVFVRQSFCSRFSVVVVAVGHHCESFCIRFVSCPKAWSFDGERGASRVERANEREGKGGSMSERVGERTG